MESIQFIKLSEDVKSPTRATIFSAGLDLYAPHKVLIKPREQTIVKTKLKVKVPIGCYARIAPKSGLSLKQLWVNAGVIDSDYTGEIGVVLFNSGSEVIEIDKNDKMCQLICEKILIPDICIVTEIPKTSRADGGFGSSGK